MKLNYITLFRSPDEGGETGGEAEPTKTLEEIAQENADLDAEFAKLDPPVQLPHFPATPQGLEQAREFMRKAIEDAAEAEAEAEAEEEEAEAEEEE